MKIKKIVPKILSTIMFGIVISSETLPVQAFTSYELDSDLNYNYEGAEAPVFYDSGSLDNLTSNANHYEQGSTKYNYQGAMPEYMQQIYGVNNQTIYNSNNGSNIVGLTGYGEGTGNTYGYGYGMNYGNYIASVESSYFDSVAGGGQYYNVNVSGNSNVVTNGSSQATSTGTSSSNSASTSSASDSSSNLNVSYTNNTNSSNVVNGVLPNEDGEVTFPSYFADINNSYNNYISTNKDVELDSYSDGSIGTIKIANANLEVKAFDYDDIYESMRKGVGHMDSTAYWNGNVVFFGHNRGSYGYFEKLKNVEVGDTVVYTTKEGTRNYKVDVVENISSTDWTDLSYTSENKITLITCIANTPSQRLLVQATEVK